MIIQICISASTPQKIYLVLHSLSNQQCNCKFVRKNENKKLAFKLNKFKIKFCGISESEHLLAEFLGPGPDADKTGKTRL